MKPAVRGSSTLAFILQAGGHTGKTRLIVQKKKEPPTAASVAPVATTTPVVSYAKSIVCLQYRSFSLIG
jgi:hypothetical protein